MRSPVGVPGPTRLSRSFCSFVSMDLSFRGLVRSVYGVPSGTVHDDRLPPGEGSVRACPGGPITCGAGAWPPPQGPLTPILATGNASVVPGRRSLPRRYNRLED